VALTTGSRGRVLVAVVGASIACLILATRTFATFTPARVKVLRAPIIAARQEILRVSIPDLPDVAGLRPPFAVITRITNRSGGRADFAIRVDGQPACDAAVPAGATARVDCTFAGAWTSSRDHDVTIASAATAWTLEYLELATHHGAAGGPQHLVVLSAASTQFERPGVAWIAVAALAVIGLLLIPAGPMPRALAIAHRVIVAGVGILLLVILVSPFFSRYVVMIGLGAWMTWLALVCAPQLWGGLRWLLGRSSGRDAAWAPAARCLVSAAIVLGVYAKVESRLLHEYYHDNYSGLIQIGRPFVDRNPILKDRADIRATLIMQNAGGYDGQWMYFMTFDPFLRYYADRPEMYQQVVDTPQYRFTRIGFSVLTKVFSADRWQWYPATMVWLIRVGLFGAALSLALLARHVGASPAWGLLMAVVPGFWPATQSTLPEPIAAALLIAGCLCVVRTRWVWAGALFALALLIRETGIVMVACLVVATFLGGRRREALWLGLIAVAPIVLWRLYVGWVLYPVLGSEAFLYTSPILGAPFAAIAAMWRGIAHGTYHPGAPTLWRSAHWYPIVLLSAAVVAARLAMRRPGPITVAAAIYCTATAVFLNANVWSHPGNAQRVSVEGFVLLAIATLDFSRLSRFLRIGVAAVWALAAAYLFYGAFDAEFVRAALSSPTW
jgi:hypothetical protein